MDTIPRHYCIHYRIIFVSLSDRTKRSFFVVITFRHQSSSYLFLIFRGRNVIKRNRRSVAYIFIDKTFLQNSLFSSTYLLLNVLYITFIIHYSKSNVLIIVLFVMLLGIRRKDASREGGEVKSARYRLRLRGAERGGTSTPSRIDRTVDASPF